MVCGTCSDYVAKVRERHDSEAKSFLFLVREAHESALRFVFHGSGDAGAFRRDVAMARCHSFLLWRLVVFWLLASAACRCPSWRMPEMEGLRAAEDVFDIVLHACQFGLKSTDSIGEGLVKKPTRVITNMASIAAHINRQCAGDHRHVHLMSGKGEGSG